LIGQLDLFEETYVLYGKMYASDGVYIPDIICTGVYEHCKMIEESAPWDEYLYTYIDFYSD